MDIVTAGFPCQPWSTSGHHKGVDDPRWLWPTIWQIVSHLEPKLVFLENVPTLNTRRWTRSGLPYILDDLNVGGFNATWANLSAAEIGAPQRRNRFWLLAVGDTDHQILCRRNTPPFQQTEQQSRMDAMGSSRPAMAERWPPTFGNMEAWRTYVERTGIEPSIRRSPHGRPPELVDSLTLAGNGLIPRVAALAFTLLTNRLTNLNN